MSGNIQNPTSLIYIEEGCDTRRVLVSETVKLQWMETGLWTVFIFRVKYKDVLIVLENVLPFCSIMEVLIFFV